jgi:hypothetical protein
MTTQSNKSLRDKNTLLLDCQDFIENQSKPNKTISAPSFILFGALSAGKTSFIDYLCGFHFGLNIGGGCTTRFIYQLEQTQMTPLQDSK